MESIALARLWRWKVLLSFGGCQAVALLSRGGQVVAFLSKGGGQAGALLSIEMSRMWRWKILKWPC